jgi:hypothetical protein
VAARGGLDRGLNELLEAWDDADDPRHIGNQANSVGADWAVEKANQRPAGRDPLPVAREAR